MTQINILSGQQPAFRGFNDFYPLFKWSPLFKKQGIGFKYFYNHLHKNILEGDLLIVDFRYLQWVESGKIKISGVQAKQGDDFFISFLEKARKKGKRIVLFDTNDGGGSNLFHLTPYVDIHLKKQLYRNKQRYTENQEYNFMPWLPSGKGLAETKNRQFTPLDTTELYKLRLGWNIGLCDYRSFPLQSYIPISSSFIFPAIYQKLSFNQPSNRRPILMAYRGTSSVFAGYDYQRNLLTGVIEKLPLKGIRTGGKIPFKAYQQELNTSSFGISPFGWGEICYRDFEIILNGALLIKPEFDYLSTYPDILVPNETFIPCRWDFSDLQNILEKYSSDTDMYFKIANEAQARFLEAQTNGSDFIDHFIRTILN